MAYNLFECKQVHILSGRQLPNEKCLEKQLSISMFFYCAGKDSYEYYAKRYENIPYLEEMPALEKETTENAVSANAEKISAVIRKTADICHLR